MRTLLADLLGKWPRKTAEFLISIMNPLVFLFLDFLDFVMCSFFRYVDEIYEGEATPCYCRNKKNRTNASEERNFGISDTLFGRENVFNKMRFFGITPPKSAQSSKKIGTNELRKTRWSECGCESCTSWMKNSDDQKLHVVIQEPSEENQDLSKSAIENVIFLHGMASSNFIWTKKVFPELGGSKYRLFAVDLLGFGSSPKPRECLYTLNDHLEMVEKSIIHEFKLTSFHLVAHSMGCMIALALAAKHPNNLKSITLVAPPYFLTSGEENASQIALKRLAYKSLWPPSSFGIAFMTWYEHLGRCACFIVCRNHRTWDRILNRVTRKRKINVRVMDWARHTHHSVWHTMHNVVCGGAKRMDPYLEILRQTRARVSVVQGSRDQVVPVECSHNIKVKVPDAEVKIINGADHRTVILGRPKEFAKDLKLIWDSVTNSKG